MTQAYRTSFVTMRNKTKMTLGSFNRSGQVKEKSTKEKQHSSQPWAIKGYNAINLIGTLSSRDVIKWIQI